MTDHSATDHSATDHSATDHSATDHSATDHSATDHSATDHGCDAGRGAEVYAMDRAHVFHSWSAQKALHPLAIAGAEGSYFWDYDGNRYLDFSSQLVNTNIGHQHPKVIAAIPAQAGRLTTIAPQHANEARGEAATRLAELAPAGLTRSSSLTAARRRTRTPSGWRGCTPAGPRCSAYRSYHGATAAAIA